MSRPNFEPDKQAKMFRMKQPRPLVSCTSSPFCQNKEEPSGSPFSLPRRLRMFRRRKGGDMVRTFMNALAGLPMTLVGGVFLLLDLIPHVMELFGRAPIQLFPLPFSPSWITVIICGLPLLYLAVTRLLYSSGISRISSALLISIAMAAAIAIGDLFAAGEVAFIMAIGALLEEATVNRARQGLKRLIDLAPPMGRRIRGGQEEMIPAADILPGDVLRVLPGESIPADGVVLTGDTSVDQSIMTGESLPVDKGVGDAVFCGTINRFGAMDITVTRTGENNSLQRLIRMVRDAEDRQAPMQRMADKAASWLVPAALLIAILAYLATENIVTAVTVLVVFCPCALVLATPTAIMAAIGQAARHGVIIKSGEALEKMGRADLVAFDKTGTLTSGRLAVSDVLSFDDSLSEADLLALTASAEAKSEHPLGRAITTFAREQGLPLTASDDFRMTAGRGIESAVGGRQYLFGNESFLREKNIPLTAPVQEALERLRREGKAAVLAADDHRCLGLIGLSDTVRGEAKDMVSRLHAMNTVTVLLTGDNRRTAEYFARQVGISRIDSELLPEEKAACITQLQGKHHTVCMIGDGVNDAPALKTADIGVAMGTMGSDIAIDTADVALMNDNIANIPYLKRLANETVKTIKLSITMSMAINFAAIILSLMSVLTPTTGALVHNAGSCFVVLIAARLYDKKLA